MIAITLACSGGFSASMLMTKMQEVAQAQGIEVDIHAVAEGNFDTFEGDTDILLLGPQISYLQEDFQTTYSNLTIAAIDMEDYGMMAGEKILDQALALYRKERGN